jgi:guanylate kinase
MSADSSDAAPDEGAPLVVVLSGPSGVGKDAVVARMQERGFNVALPATMTTRPPREGEREGVNHLFVDAAGFDRAVGGGELLEHALVYGNRYGVPRSQVRKHLERGADVIIRVDIQGAESLRQVLPGALFLFLVPDDPAHLEAHLRERDAESDEQIALRLAEAASETDRARAFATIVENIEGDLDATVDRVAALMAAERERAGREPVDV